jgi:hypothetical protein
MILLETNDKKDQFINIENNKYRCNIHGSLILGSSKYCYCGEQKGVKHVSFSCTSEYDVSSCFSGCAHSDCVVRLDKLL